MRSALYLCLLASALYGLVICDHHEGHQDQGKGGQPGHSGHDHHRHHHHHHGGKEHDHKPHGSDNMTCHKIAPALSEFAFSMFREAAAAGDSHNVFFSPVSIGTAFAMLSLGAKGATRSQILEGLGFNLTKLPLAGVHEGFNHLIHRLNDPSSDLKLSTGNTLFIRQGFKLLQNFLDAAKDEYAADAFSSNFQNEAEAIKQINDYVANKTNGKIVDLLKSLDPDTKLVLINHIFFRGQWENPFRVQMTKEGDFHVDANTTVKVPMMRRTGMYSLTRDQALSCTVLKMPYKGGASAMFILPDAGKMKQVQDALSVETIRKWLPALERSHTFVNVQLPKFTISTTMDLKKHLGKLGMTDAFSDQADFSGFTGERDLKVSKAVHKAVLSVDERGTEAAGATVIEIMPVSFPPRFAINHPFFMTIYHKETRSTLFMGRVVNPNAA
ncbi:alpha-1-antitrypsin-like [Ambystoma mexicanum]|uniref:alpha-1-antitrypsin-like n=1 Tax=Ambystoma mexicanum TaxID=8296 RepID=UPI0037E74A1E